MDAVNKNRQEAAWLKLAAPSLVNPAIPTLKAQQAVQKQRTQAAQKPYKPPAAAASPGIASGYAAGSKSGPIKQSAQEFATKLATNIHLGGPAPPFGAQFAQPLNTETVGGKRAEGEAVPEPVPPPPDTQQLVPLEAAGQPLANRQKPLGANPTMDELFKKPSTANQMFQQLGQKLAMLQARPTSGNFQLEKARRMFRQDAYQRQPSPYDASNATNRVQDEVKVATWLRNYFTKTAAGRGFHLAGSPAQPQPNTAPQMQPGAPGGPLPQGPAPPTGPSPAALDKLPPVEPPPSHAGRNMMPPTVGDRVNSALESVTPDPNKSLGQYVDQAKNYFWDAPGDVGQGVDKALRGDIGGGLNAAPGWLRGVLAVGGGSLLIYLLSKLFGKQAAYSPQQVKTAQDRLGRLSSGQRAQLVGQMMAEKFAAASCKSAPRHSYTTKVPRTGSKFAPGNQNQGPAMKKVAKLETQDDERRKKYDRARRVQNIRIAGGRASFHEMTKTSKAAAWAASLAKAAAGPLGQAANAGAMAGAVGPRPAAPAVVPTPAPAGQPQMAPPKRNYNTMKPQAPAQQAPPPTATPVPARVLMSPQQKLMQKFKELGLPPPSPKASPEMLQKQLDWEMQRAGRDRAVDAAAKREAAQAAEARKAQGGARGGFLPWQWSRDIRGAVDAANRQAAQQ